MKDDLDRILVLRALSEMQMLHQEKSKWGKKKVAKGQEEGSWQQAHTVLSPRTLICEQSHKGH